VTAFFAVAAEWFWGRWFAIGLGYWGCTMAVMSFVTTRSFEPAMVVFGTLHGLVSVCLMGEKMAAMFDAKPEWRARWKLDEQGVVRVRRSVTRMASSLPALVLFALAPRQGESAQFAAFDATTWTLLAFGLISMAGILWTRRTWAVIALGAVGAATAVKALAPASLWLWCGAPDVIAFSQPTVALHLVGLFAGLTLVAATLPFARPMVRYLTGR
jgi:hypothetical protein